MAVPRPQAWKADQAAFDRSLPDGGAYRLIMNNRCSNSTGGNSPVHAFELRDL
jgi:hypothetical protein